MASSLDVTTRNLMLDVLATAVTHLSMHHGDPGGTGANEVGTRVAVSWGTSSAGSKALAGTPINFTVPTLGGDTMLNFIGMWNALTTGTWRGTFDIVDEPFPNGGTYQLTSGSVTLS